MWNSINEFKLNILYLDAGDIVRDKVIKLRDDGQLMGRCLIISQATPEPIAELTNKINKYELSVMSCLTILNLKMINECIKKNWK